jgi:outer membrane immunogenic protein
MAAAADMPLKAPPLPPAPVVLLWDNVYIGLEGGYGQAHQSWDQNTTSCIVGCAALDRVTGNVNGGLAGGLFGFNRQINNVVYGVEFTWDAADINGSRAHDLTPFSTRTHFEWMSTLAGRIGFLLAGERTLLYAKGGFGLVDQTNQINDAAGVRLTTRLDTTRRAFVVGGGAEFMFSGAVSAKIEYNYLGFIRDHNFEFSGIAGAPFGTPFAGLVENWRANQQLHVLKVGLNWHFMPAPVIARY